MTDAAAPAFPPPGVAPAPRPPRRRAPKIVWWLLGLLVAGLLAVWLLSPWWILARMQRALAERDATALSAYVDYPAVRESLKPVIAARVRNELLQQVNRYGGAGAAAGLGLGGLVAQVTAAATAAAVDTAVTPAGLMALMMGAQARDAAGAAAGAVPVPPPATLAPALTPAPGPVADARAPLRFRGGYEGLNRFGVTLLPPSGGEIRFVMQRRGFASWRLVEIVPPT